MQLTRDTRAPFLALALLALGVVTALATLVGGASPARAQSATEIVVRLNQLEEEVRRLSGQVEELTFQNRQLREQLQRFQEDVDFRFQEMGGPGSSLPPAASPTPQQRSDVFDPSASPAAPGAPQPLGTTTPSTPLGAADAPPPEGGGAPLDIAAILRGEAPLPSVERSGPSIAATGSEDPRFDYDSAYAYLLQRQYERAEMGFRQYLQSHPRDALVPDATFWLGETYAQRGRHREAAEQFLKVSTEFETSPKAPDAMLKLGTSLIELGAREQACATFAELTRRYDDASAPVREAVERERRRASCG
ncbi:tol-pal system protein YbgF [Salinarimonas ramus]|uniref:Cell division coordinator CpoB n=1 Tax=Salinarimonas ramus TaxID=690164 RepID=A0A917Q863_9HYPH|nr:tol-pal system protein YbgF [Salinarimonas ramus]GGK35088.1 tol-pal system protein YbgF [Salinarimonas ramus]